MAAKKKNQASKGGGAAPRRVPAQSQRRDVLMRNGVALLVAALTVAAVARLFAFGAWLQLGLVVAACAGLLATSPLWAAVIAVVAVAAGLTVTLGSFSAAIAVPAAIALPAAVALVVAPAIRWFVGRRPAATDWVAYAVMALIVANMWATTLYVNLPHPEVATPVAQVVAQSPKLGVQWNDAEFYRRVLWHMRAGTGYYESFRLAFNENVKWGVDPFSVLSYRLPTAFWLWASLPGGPIAIFVAWLVLSTGAFVAGMRLAYRRVPVAFALPAAAVLASYLVYFGTSDVILFTEAWAAAVGIIAVAAAVESFGSKAWRGWTLTAVALAILACLVRELMVYLPVAGVIAAVVAGGPQRRFRMSAWTGGLGLFAVAYVGHVVAIGGAVSGKQPTAQVLVSGGLRFFSEAFSWATAIIGGGAAMLALLGVMAAAGIWLTPDLRERWFLAIAAALPLAAFLVFGNDARFADGTTTNYWGTIIVPVLIVLSPWAFAAVPGVASKDRENERAQRSG